ncbi:IRK-interacting protein [Phoenix dactylifera]|uniref:IRK-interacting protein n=1 Tax=Phoenix dactylifera TaxID=42345 RepID=A0A8B8J7F7_PHODC|nr:IRK-interacting protein [Phoenix dactylifera]
MASSTATQAQGIQRRDVQAAMAKAVELRALHAALLQGSGGSPAVQRLQPGASPSLSRGPNQCSADDYPVFAPSYEAETLPGNHYICPENQSLSEIWSGIVLGGEDRDDEAISSDNKSVNKFSSSNSEQHICSSNNYLSNGSPYLNHMSLLQIAPGDDKSASRRTSSGEFKTVATSNTCKPATSNRESENDRKNTKNITSTAPVPDTQPSIQLHRKQRGPILSWLFPKSKKTTKSEMSPNMIESEDMSQCLKDWGLFSLESLKKELLEANEKRDAALAEVAEMKSSLGELRQKLASLETYCEEMKKALKQAVQAKDTQVLGGPNLSKRAKSISGSRDNLIPVSLEVMVEGFLQIVSEARLSVKQLCKTLIHQIEETDSDLMEKLNLLLQPHHVTLSNKYSKGVLYHLEALINQSLYEDFENCVFQKNGSRKFLDPQQDHQENFSAFVALRNLSWNEVLQKGTKYYSEEFSKFCDQKMSCIISILNWSRPWPEQLLQSFFVAAKCIWLLHLLAFSFSPPLAILRVGENRSFDHLYMEDILFDRHRARAPAQVKIMVMPGFYVQEKVLRCRVLCRYRSVA